MADQNQNSPTSQATNPFLALFDQLDRVPAQPSAPQQPQPSGPSPLVNVGGQFLPLEASRFAGMNVDPAADMQQILKFMPQLSAGPYSSTPAGDNVTANMYHRQLASPYVTSIAQRLGDTHPRLASAIDAALLGAQGAEAAHEKAVQAGGGAAGWGAGLSSVVSGLEAAPEMQLARRMQLEQTPLQFQQEEAQLEQSRTGSLHNLMGALSEFESNPARILAQYGRNFMATQAGAQSREKIAALNAAERFQQALNSDATKTAIAHMQASVKRSTATQVAALRQRFLGSLDSHVQAINARYQKLENSPAIDPVTLASRPRSQDEIQQLESERQQEIEQEMGYGEFASQQIFGHGLLAGIMPQNTPQQTPTPNRTKPNKRASNAPPINLLKEGVNTHFANGQTWTLKNGTPVQVGTK